MFHDPKPYSDYVETGSPWLRRVPSHWRMPRIKTVVREVSDKGHPSEPLLVATQSRGVIRKDQYENRTVEAMNSLETLKLVTVGDFVISLRSFQGGIERAHARGIISPAYTILRPLRASDTDYLTLLFKSLPFIDALRLAVTGIREGQNIEYPRLARDMIPLPPPAEQEAIVTYLAHAHQRINQAIATKRRLLALLEEARRVVLEEAFGDISARDHTRLKYVAAVQTGLTLGKDYGAAKTRAYPYLRVANVQAGALALDNIAEVQVPEAEAARCTLQKGDLLMTEGGDIDKLGRGTIWNGEIERCLHQNHVFAVRCREVIEPRFLEAFLRHSAARTYFYMTAKKTTNLAATNSRTLGNLRLPLFSLEEQAAVVSLIDGRAARVDRQIDAARREVHLLEEFRTRLTSGVVTGQLDVRQVAAALPSANPDGAFGAWGGTDLEDDELVVADDEQGEDWAEHVADE